MEKFEKTFNMNLADIWTASGRLMCFREHSLSEIYLIISSQDTVEGLLNRRS